MISALENIEIDFYIGHIINLKFQLWGPLAPKRLNLPPPMSSSNFDKLSVLYSKMKKNTELGCKYPPLTTPPLIPPPGTFHIRHPWDLVIKPCMKLISKSLPSQDFSRLENKKDQILKAKPHRIAYLSHPWSEHQIDCIIQTCNHNQ